MNYDRYGRMIYTPSFHKKHYKPWNKADLEYLINWYDIIGSAEMSLALERPENAIRTKIYQIRKEKFKNESCRN
ncbi:hypothetical protein ACFO6R_14790 [Eubacterium multiforme]|uniref:Uncharacterized protein n=1 Tax=Eubacterium multiforme TaxID=83339 RepID=A0ABT9UWL5_9FIRM|nr:hypothetical protein [Eubacterium multiforme]MDQ0150702.1 hypothetical protein [Eubacterium multiforme]